MPTTENPHKRAEPRVLYRAPVWLRAEGDGASLIGETRNLSRRGMFVSVVPTPELGQTVICELPGRREVHGRVAWVFQPRSPEAQGLTGVGIEFVDLSADGIGGGAALIESLTGMLLDEAQPVNVWFNGLPSPTRSIAEVTHTGIELSTTLAFLRIGSEVEVAPVGASDPGRLHGRISRVELHMDDGSPRLAISLSVLPERAPVALEPEDERWFPVIVVDEPLQDTLGLELAPPPVALTAAQIEWEIETRIDAEVAHEAAPPEDLDDPLERAASAMEVIDVEPTDRTRAAPPELRPRSRALGLGLVLGVMAAGAVVLRVGFPAGGNPAALPSLPPSATVAPAAEAVAAEELPLEAEPVEAIPVEAKAKPSAPVALTAATPAPRVEPSRVEPARVEPSKAAPVKGGPWKPSVTLVGAMQTLIVPISGSAKGMTHYPLDEPAGVAVDLPLARGAVPLKPYPLHDGSFNSLWVRTRPQGGLQIRLHTPKGVRVVVEPVEAGLRFRRVE